MVRAGRAGGWGSAACPVCACEQQGEPSSAKPDSAAHRALSSRLGPTQAGTWVPGPSQGRPQTGEVGGCSLCLLLSSALQLAFTCGNIQAPWITFYHSDSNWSSSKFWGRTGSQLLLLPPLASAAISLLGEMSADRPTPGFLTWALWVFGRRSSLRHTTNSLLMWLDSRKKRNSVHSQLVTSLCYNATPHLLETYLHSSSQAAATQVKINILTCDSCGRV